MPIYQFKCPACGTDKEVLQHRDAPPPECPACLAAAWSGEPRHVAMERQLVAPGFRLKGEGNYGRGRV
jgi:putative FmdB family regulatory protein